MGEVFFFFLIMSLNFLLSKIMLSSHAALPFTFLFHVGSYIEGTVFKSVF